MNSWFLLSLLLVALPLTLAQPTCQECVLILAELQVAMTSFDEEMVRHLHDNFCVNEELNNPECRMTAGHYPDMLDVIMEHRFDPLLICEYEELCSKSSYHRVMLKENRDVTCEQCDRFMRVIRRHLTGENDMENFKNLLKSHVYCGKPTPPFANCEQIVEQYFVEMHFETMEWFFHPHAFCVFLGICDNQTGTPTPTP
eukprot:maker-scaffold341_size202020-snap-gene-0.6 protein:Tk03627 transcript:maker-scaffold341_size202020-snap-gene-0.6-mRNA-1 annotation:"hypothetical protein DICPUDRAFT_155998"